MAVLLNCQSRQYVNVNSVATEHLLSKSLVMTSSPTLHQQCYATLSPTMCNYFAAHALHVKLSVDCNFRSGPELAHQCCK